MRLIDADALIEAMEDVDSWLLYDDWGNQTVTKDLIDNAPTIDAVEVVRCKDCKHAYKRKPINKTAVLCEPNHDRDWIVGCIKHDGFIHTDRGDKANHIILEALEADTVEVVRCKDCKHKVITEDGEYNPEDIVCDYWMSDGLTENDFCSYGERKDGDI